MNGRINECGGVEILYYSSKYVLKKRLLERENCQSASSVRRNGALWGLENHKQEVRGKADE